MFTIGALLLAVLFLLVALAMPFVRPNWARAIVRRIEGFVARRRGRIVFYRRAGADPLPLIWVRVWGAVAAILFGCAGLLLAPLFQDSPRALVETLLGASAAAAGSTLLLVTWFCYKTFVRRARGCAALKRAGHQSAWVVGPSKIPADLQDALTARFRRSSFMGIVDATGQELLGRNSGPLGALMYDVIATTIETPVSVLLMCHEATALDPESRQLTVCQSVLYEMDIPPAMFKRRVQATLELVDELNVKRSDGAKIDVRFYNEKPTITAVVFDDAALVAPFSPRETERCFSLFEAGAVEGEATFSKVFRDEFVRLWAHSLPIGAVAKQAPALGSKVLRRKAVATKAPAATHASAVAPVPKPETAGART